MKYYIFPVLLCSILFFSFLTFSQTSPQSSTKPYEDDARKIISEGLQSCKAYSMLQDLCLNVGSRLVGSPAAEKAVNWGKELMLKLGFQNVHTEVCTVPHWVRGDVEKGSIINSSGKLIPINICALGGSIGTTENGIEAEVLEVKSFDELQSLKDEARGKIIFFNRAMDKSKINSGEAYGGAVNQRGSGAVEAAKVGGVAALVRSMTMQLDNVPHTGSMHYVDTIPKVPAAAISTVGANMLDSLLSIDKNLKVKIQLSCQTLPDVESANVIGEIKGSEKPEEVIVIGCHLDSWDKGHGAHDDGAGTVHVIEALRLIKDLGLKPKRTIRAVLFMNEEFGLNGGIAYAKKDRPGEKHICAIETDAGGFTPRGFGVGADSITFPKFSKWSYLLDPIDAGRITRGGGGADISELAKLGVVTIGLRVDGQRYFDYHHSDNDTFDKVHPRELELGAVAIAIFSYVIAQEGI
ncbi:MAG: M20/M25/M40 family metallo-hydrolase [Ignavibacteriales bacterium]|nr:M20/M25/M40 family metallo-hydrolase [Ignavibacteriales bacterium]